MPVYMLLWHFQTGSFGILGSVPNQGMTLGVSTGTTRRMKHLCIARRDTVCTIMVKTWSLDCFPVWCYSSDVYFVLRSHRFKQTEAKTVSIRLVCCFLTLETSFILSFRSNLWPDSSSRVVCTVKIFSYWNIRMVFVVICCVCVFIHFMKCVFGCGWTMMCMIWGWLLFRCSRLLAVWSKAFTFWVIFLFCFLPVINSIL